MLNGTACRKELLRMAVEKHESQTGVSDPTLRLFVTDPRRPGMHMVCWL